MLSDAHIFLQTADVLGLSEKTKTNSKINNVTFSFTRCTIQKKSVTGFTIQPMLVVCAPNTNFLKTSGRRLRMY